VPRSNDAVLFFLEFLDTCIIRATMCQYNERIHVLVHRRHRRHVYRVDQRALQDSPLLSSVRPPQHRTVDTRF
jgi:hypothetical protein